MENNIKIYPNPTQGKVFIKSDIEDKTTVNLYDITGKKVFSSITNQSGLLFDISGYGLKGLYLLQLRDETGRIISEQKMIFE